MAEAENKTLIFTETKKRADELTMRMRREGSAMFACTALTWWHGSATGRALGLQSVGCGFKSYLKQRCVTALGKLFTPMCLCHQAV